MSEKWWLDARDADKRKEFMNQKTRPSDKTGSLRFWMPKGEERRIVMLTASPTFCISEHNSVKINGTYRNNATCLKMIDKPCPLCDAGDYPVHVCAFTIIDTHKFTDKSGKDHENTRRLLIAKQATWELLERRYRKLQEAGLDLRGAVLDVYRGKDSKSCSVGEQFDYVDHCDLDANGFESTDEFDYAELFAPDPDMVALMASQFTPRGGESTARPLETRTRPSFD